MRIDKIRRFSFFSSFLERLVDDRGLQVSIGGMAQIGDVDAELGM